MSTTLLDLDRAINGPPRFVPAPVPEWLQEPLARHDCGLCGCTEDDHCTAALWSEGCIPTETAKERLGL